jgi:copper(I)-binding protein
VGSDLRMRELADGLAVATGTTLTLKPRGYHLMLLDLKAPLEPGGRVPVTLTFEKAGNIDIELVVAPAGPVGREAM